MTERNEQTSPGIASFAAEVMRMDDAELVRQAYHEPALFRSAMASLVAQAPDSMQPVTYRQGQPKPALNPTKTKAPVKTVEPDADDEPAT